MLGINQHQDWKGVPGTISDKYLPLWNGTNFVDRYIAFVYATTKDGKRYCRAVELPGSKVVREGARRLEEVIDAVGRLGPRVCTEIIGEDAILPREADQPPLE